jgi:hypothetical protein
MEHAMNFRKAINEYNRLKSAYQAGDLTASKFEDTVNEMRVSDAQGNQWMIGVSSGKWYRLEGETWKEDTPPQLEVESSAETMVGSVVGNFQVPSSEQETSVESIPAEKISPAQPPEKKSSRAWLWIVGIIIVLGACCVVIAAGLILTGTIELPESLAALGPATATSTSTSTRTTIPTQIPTSTNTPTPTSPPATLTPTPTPINTAESLKGKWFADNTDAEYEFYDDGTYFFYKLDGNLFFAGDYQFVGSEQLALEILYGEEVIDSWDYTITFADENSMRLEDSEGNSGTWTKGNPTGSTSRTNAPISVLFELAYRLGWDAPDPECGFDTEDEASEYQYVCLRFQNGGPYVTWVDQSPSLGTDRDMERNLLTIYIDHESYGSFIDHRDGLYGMEETDFHRMTAYQSSLELGFFSMEDFGWLDNPWLYKIFRVDSFDSRTPPHTIQFTAETIFEILQGIPPSSIPTTTPVEQPDGDFLYSQTIIGTWIQRHESLETLVFMSDGSINVSSVPGDYDYDGTFYFENDHFVIFNLDVGDVSADIEIQDDVMTLTINGVDNIYDREE